MMRAAPAGSRYCDQRRYVTPADLGDLRGPTRGRVILDQRLDWSGSPEYDLDDSGDLQVMYQTVLNEAAAPADLERWLDAAILRHIWPELWLPGQLRALWESRFPELAARPLAAAG